VRTFAEQLKLLKNPASSRGVSKTKRLFRSKLRRIKPSKIKLKRSHRMKLWWAYLHKYGSIQVKEWYTGNTYLKEARVSPNIKRFLEEPFEAISLEEAQEVAKKLLVE
jgi:hypothetical protein